MIMAVTKSRLHRCASLGLALTAAACVAPPGDRGSDDAPEVAYLRTAEGILEVAYESDGEWVTFQDDMLVRVEEFERNRIDPADLDVEIARLAALEPADRAAVRAAGSARWPGGDIPYVPYLDDDNLTGTEKGAIWWAMRHWEQNTPFRFHERDGESDYIRFVHDDECKSPVGRQGGRQDIHLSDCSSGVTAHEIGHSIGFFHEQSRYDRDTFITVDLSNIIDAKKHNWARYVESTPSGPARDGQDAGDYDYGSIMHYGRRTSHTDWLIDPTGSDVVITTKPPGIPIGQRDGLSRGDIDAAIRIFQGVPTVDRAGPRATLYRDASYQGTSQAFLPGLAIVGEVNQLDVVGDNQASSLVVPPGLAVRLCANVAPDPDPCQWFTRSAATLPAPLDNQVSYISVRRAVTVYANAGLSGDRQTFLPGTYRADEGDLAEVGNDKISSISVPPGMIAELCLSETGPGSQPPNCQTFEGNVSDIGDLLDNKVSLVRVRSAVTLYKEGNLWGERKSLPVGTYGASAFAPVTNNSVSSLVIGFGLKATLCDDSDGGGPCTVFRGDVHFVGASLNDKGSWLKVESNTAP